MRCRDLLKVGLLCSGLVSLPAVAVCTSTASGDLRLHQFASHIFGNTRTLRVLLPERYDSQESRQKRYPVLYLLDGQNLFDACLSDVSHEEWKVDETLYRLVREKVIPEMIVVGIDHAGAKRAYEFLPYQDYYNPLKEEPAGKRFPDFLTDEVMPFINEHYRTLTGEPNTGIGGSSYGGVASLYALLTKPGSFGYGLIESPTLWVGMGQLVRDTNPLVILPEKVFLAFGGKESDNAAGNEKMISLVRMVEANFKAAGYDDAHVRVVVDADARHNEVAWAKRFPQAVTFLFGDWKPRPETNAAQ